MIEEGFNTSALSEKYIQAKGERDKALKEAESFKAKYINCKAKLKEKLRETMNYLKKC